MAAKPKVKTTPKTMDEYLAMLSGDKRAALERVRRIIRDAVPGIEEGISYRIPAFRLDRKWLLWLGAGANHCAIYGVGGVDPAELAAYDTSGKGTVRFQPDHPLPATLIRKLVKARIAANARRRPAAARGR
jgi:uncharacterized protein YdhG (YjbR/CyaY superfamily)